MLDLDRQLTAARQGLLQRIDIPELGGVRERARTIRRRRRGFQAGAAALTLVAVLGVSSVLTSPGTGEQRAPAGSAAPSPTPEYIEYRGSGLSMLGLNGPVTDLPGTLVDIQFADQDHGYALAADCTQSPCLISLAATVDRGHSWTTWNSPIPEADPQSVPRLVTVGTAGLAVIGADTYYSPSDSPQWTPVNPSGSPVNAVPEGGRLLLSEVNSSATCLAEQLEVWVPVAATVVTLANQPTMQVCRVAPAPAPDGAWWVSGTANGVPAVGVSRNGGNSWDVRALPAAGGNSWALVTTVGTEAYATVVTPRDDNPTTLTIEAVYRASTSDLDFTPYSGQVGTAVGEMIPLLDGRLLAAGPNFYVSAGPGEQMHPAGGSLPPVGRLERSPGGWIAYNLFEAGWVAISTDGVNWQKLNVR